MQKNTRYNTNGDIFNIPPHLIKPNHAMARTDFPDMSLVTLADSIKRYGMLQPIAVRISEKGRYELIAGERRLRAAMLLHLPTVPCIMPECNGDPDCLSVVENLQREKLTMFDEARAVRRLYEKNGRDPAKTAKLLSMGEGELLYKIRLCELSRAEMQAITSLGITENEVRPFLDVPKRLRYYTIKLCAEKGYTLAENTSLCQSISKNKDLTPDDLEPFADSFFARNADTPKCTPSMPSAEDTAKNHTVVLKDLRSFEISLRKICAILENAGCRTRIRISSDTGRTTYTVTIDTKNG